MSRAMAATPTATTTVAPRANPATAPLAPAPRAISTTPVPILTTTSDTFRTAIRRNRCCPWKYPVAVAPMKIMNTAANDAGSTQPRA